MKLLKILNFLYMHMGDAYFVEGGNLTVSHDSIMGANVTPLSMRSYSRAI